MGATNLLEFFEKYPDEASRIEGFKAKRLEMGIICKKCKHTKHYFRKTDLKFQYKKCGSHVSPLAVNAQLYYKT